MLSHKADTDERHRVLPAASFATWLQLHPRAFISRSTDLLHVSFGRPLLFPPGVQRMATLGMDIGGILLTWPIHLHLLYFTSNEMGSTQVRSWSSALVILFGQKMCRILLRHLFWNTSSMWHIPQYVPLENAYLCFLADNFRLPDVLQSRKFSPCLVDPCLDFSLCIAIICHFGSQVCELRYVFYVLFSESDLVCCLRVVSHCFGFVFVDIKSNCRCVSDQFLSFTLYVSLWLCASRDMSSAKSRSPII